MLRGPISMVTHFSGKLGRAFAGYEHRGGTQVVPILRDRSFHRSQSLKMYPQHQFRIYDPNRSESDLSLMAGGDGLAIMPYGRTIGTLEPGKARLASDLRLRMPECALSRLPLADTGFPALGRCMVGNRQNWPSRCFALVSGSNPARRGRERLDQSSHDMLITFGIAIVVVAAGARCAI